MTSAQKECRIIVADDHPFVTAGIKHFLTGNESIEVIGTAHDSGEIVNLLDHTECDILISDYSMPNGKYGDGIKFFSFLRRRYPNLNVIVYTVIEEPTLLTKIKRLGIRSVVDKSSDMEMLLTAINAVRAYGSRSPGHVATERAESGVAHEQRRCALTPQEAEVVRLFISGLTVDEIARKLCRSKKTISTQKNAAKNKLGVKRDVELYRLFLCAD